MSDLKPSDGRMGPYDRYIGVGKKRRGVWDRRLPTSQIADVGNMRHLVIDHVETLARSMAEDGQQMAILVNRRKLDSGRIIYERIDGEHRWRACILNRQQVMSTIFDNLPPKETMQRMLSANIHLDPESLEWANKIQQNFLYWRSECDGDGTVASYCRETGLTASKVHNALRVIENLHPDVLEIHKRGDILWGTIVELARLESQELQLAWAIEAVNGGLNHMTMRKKVSIHLQTQANGKLELGGLFSEEVASYHQTRQLLDPILEKATLHFVEWLSRVARLVQAGLQSSKVFPPRRTKALHDLKATIDWIVDQIPTEDEEDGNL